MSDDQTIRSHDFLLESPGEQELPEIQFFIKV